MINLLIDTSVFGFALETSNNDKVIATKKFLQLLRTHKTFSAYISAITLVELENTPGEKLRKELFKLVSKLRLNIVSNSEEIEKISHIYIKRKIIPDRYVNDARLLASAAVSKISILVTWNLKHMANVITKQKVNEVNREFNYPSVDIVTPMEFEI